MKKTKKANHRHYQNVFNFLSNKKEFAFGGLCSHGSCNTEKEKHRKIIKGNWNRPDENYR